MKFPCTSCGLCCTKVGQTVKWAKEILASQIQTNPHVKELAEFPYDTTADGACEHLQADHSCGVYDHRPDICNIERTREKHHANISTLEYYEQTAELCNNWIIHAGMADHYLIDIRILEDAKKHEQGTGGNTGATLPRRAL